MSCNVGTRAQPESSERAAEAGSSERGGTAP